MIAKSSTGCRGARKSIQLMYKGVFYCSMMVVSNCINSAVRPIDRVFTNHERLAG